MKFVCFLFLLDILFHFERYKLSIRMDGPEKINVNFGHEKCIYHKFLLKKYNILFNRKIFCIFFYNKLKIFLSIIL